MNYQLNQLVDQHVAELRQDAAVHRLAAPGRPERTPVRTVVGNALVRAGKRLAAAPARTAATQ